MAAAVKIISTLDSETALRSIGELLEQGPSFVDFEARLVGRVEANRLSIAYRASGFTTTRLRMASFIGKVLPNHESGSVITGVIEPSSAASFVYVFLLLWFAFVIVSDLLQSNIGGAILGILLGVVFLRGVKVYLASIKRHIVDELCRATRGRAA